MGLFSKKQNNNEIVIYSPVDGVVKELSEVDDEVFAGEMVGKGVAVVPTSSTIYSPVTGTIKSAFPTGHAYGIATKAGPEVLVHIGVDTVGLNGEGFNIKANVNKSVTPTTELADIDLDVINKKAKASDIMVIITNDSLGEYTLSDIATGKVKRGDKLFILKKTSLKKNLAKTR